ncbi:hypothetical protein H9P43_005381 [Blastocladiella emersonii ATCC 22665]|nr:hypothetical protein H9P43_005381 [Blastocladiella emersonii ATCC 22665]
MQSNAPNPNHDPLVEWGAYRMPASLARILNGQVAQIDALTQERDDLLRHCHVQQQTIEKQENALDVIRTQRDYYFKFFAATPPTPAPASRTTTTSRAAAQRPVLAAPLAPQPAARSEDAAVICHEIRNKKHKQMEAITESSKNWIRSNVHDPRLYGEGDWEEVVDAGYHAVVQDILDTYGDEFDMDGIRWRRMYVETKAIILFGRIIEAERIRVEYGVRSKYPPLTQPAPPELLQQFGEHWIRGAVHDPRLYDEDDWEALIARGTEAVVEDILETFGTVFDMDGVHWTANLIEIKVAKLLRRILEDERKRIEYGLPAKGSPLTQPAPEDLIRELEEEFGYRY